MGFSKFKAAFENNALSADNNIEGPEQLVNVFETANKVKKAEVEEQSKKAPKKDEAVNQRDRGRGNRSRGRGQFISRGYRGDGNSRGRGVRGNNYRGKRFTQGDDKNTLSNTKIEGEPLKNGNVEAQNTEEFNFETFSDDRNRAAINRNYRRGRFNNSRGFRERGKNQKHEMDRHSGMANSKVKATETLHGRDDNDWKDEIDGEIEAEQDFEQETNEINAHIDNSRDLIENGKVEDRNQVDGNTENKEYDETRGGRYNNRGGYRRRGSQRVRGNRGGRFHRNYDRDENGEKNVDSNENDMGVARRGRGRGGFRGNREGRGRFQKPTNEPQQEYVKFTNNDFPSL